jgi:hypothetical protein
LVGWIQADTGVVSESPDLNVSVGFSRLDANVDVSKKGSVQDMFVKRRGPV